jgi:hypothetical protein
MLNPTNVNKTKETHKTVLWDSQSNVLHLFWGWRQSSQHCSEKQVISYNQLKQPHCDTQAEVWSVKQGRSKHFSETTDIGAKIDDAASYTLALASTVVLVFDPCPSSWRNTCLHQYRRLVLKGVPLFDEKSVPVLKQGPGKGICTLQTSYALRHFTTVNNTCARHTQTSVNGSFCGRLRLNLCYHSEARQTLKWLRSVPSYEMWCRVALVRTDVSKECIACIIRVTGIASLFYM